MTVRLRHSLLLAMLALCCVSAQAQQTDDLQQRMTGAEFKAAGLDKLSPQELQNLDDWLIAHGKVTTKVVTKTVTETGKPVFYPEQSKRTKILAHVAGHFGGLGTGKEIKLDNGQMWKQVGEETPACMQAEKPSVKIKPALMGRWLMSVDGCNSTVYAERVN